VQENKVMGWETDRQLCTIAAELAYVDFGYNLWALCSAKDGRFGACRNGM